MIAYLYQTYYRHILWAVALSLPLFWYQSTLIKSNNNIETWMPRDGGVRRIYEQFKQDFGAEEVILIGLERNRVSPEIVEALAGRLERLPGIRGVWTPERLFSRMGELGVPPESQAERLDGLLGSPDSGMIGVFAVLSDIGTQDRAGTVEAVREALDYCRLTSADVALTGAPVIVTELDRLGNAKASKGFFFLTLAITLGLLYFSLRHWGLSLGILGVTVWGIYLTQAVIGWCGGEMNFILGSLSVMVMIFTLSIAVHFVSYYSDAVLAGHEDPLGHAFTESWNPCFLSTITTLLGLLSLNVSSILPVAQFGYAAALGAIVALFVGLGVVPALLMVFKDAAVKTFSIHHVNFSAWAGFINRNRYVVLGSMTGLMVLMTAGVLKLRPDVNPVEFLPKNSQVLTDLRRVEKGLTNVDSIEAVVDFSKTPMAFVDQLEKVRSIEAKIRRHEGVRHTLSLTTFFPIEMPDSPLATARMFSTARSYQGEGLVADEQRLWRIAIRVRDETGMSADTILHDIEKLTAGEPIHFTGMTPLLDSAQKEIFAGFWQSFTEACITISLVMFLSLRSITTTAIAMIPNIVPILLVFGGVGFLGMPVDIGMMMTGSITLGISVDCTFHFLVQYREHIKRGETSAEAVRRSMEHSGEPMLDSTIICSMGMMALCLSSFAPTARFGSLMAAQMIASLLGELVMLPALLCCLPARKAAVPPDAANDPHVLAVSPPAAVAENTETSTTSNNEDAGLPVGEPHIHRLPAPHLRPNHRPGHRKPMSR